MSWLLGCRGNDQELEGEGSFRCVLFAFARSGAVNLHGLRFPFALAGMTCVFTVTVAVCAKLSI